MFAKLIAGTACFVALHTLVWFSTNLQFVNDKLADKSFQIMLGCSLPISLLAYYGSRFTYEAMEESAWSVRFIAFGTSYLVFPLLTWWMLKESIFMPKTMICIALSFLILGIQLFWK
ncbi:hypothetical protein OAA09_00385 [bacterium]|nr:hypothetical protein [bacterium]